MKPNGKSPAVRALANSFQDSQVPLLGRNITQVMLPPHLDVFLGEFCRQKNLERNQGASMLLAYQLEQMMMALCAEIACRMCGIQVDR